ncbi:exostosin family protein [Candidatus Kaiserbacteria bacterium]|nr:exostosin family protein [Candidatus Kaiserbacteria bacterium]
MAKKPLLMWVDATWRRAYTHAPLMYPFWGIQASDKTPFTKRLFETYSFDTNEYGLAQTVDEADIVFLPYRYNVLREKGPSLIAEAASLARSAKKPILIDGTGDLEYQIDIPHAIILRIAGYRFFRTPNEIHVPLYVDDLLERVRGGVLDIRKKQEKARVGFSGWAGVSPIVALKAIIKELPYRMRGLLDPRYRVFKKGVFLRARALRILGNSSRIETNFIARPTYSAHTATASADPETLQKQFVENLLESDYGLDVRGDPNASARLYEICSLGRIPLIVDTARNLPFSDELDYSTFSLIVDYRDMHRLPQIVADFHEKLSPEKFEAMQRAAREAYRNYFRIDAMTKHLVKRIKTLCAAYSA